MIGGGYTAYAVGYNTRYGYSVAGGSDSTILYDSASDDLYVALAASHYSYLIGGGITAYSVGFGTTYGYSTAGGHDTAQLYDTAGNETFVGLPTYSYMVGAASTDYVVGFKQITAYGTAGGTDTAQLFDSSGNDLVNVAGNTATLTTPNGEIDVVAYDRVTANRSSGFDRERVRAHDFIYAGVGGWIDI
jgi:hypothetical protein